jgi:branched-chain amino acid transport system substrate-binding protein
MIYFPSHMIPRKIAVFLVAASMLFTLGGPSQAAPAPYVLDIILAETGPGAGLGSDEAVALGLEEKAINAAGGINGQPVRFAIQDDQTNPQIALQLTTQILQKHPLVVIGSSLVASCAAMAPLFVNGPVHFCLSEAFEPPPGSHSFGAGAPTDDLLTPMFTFMRARGMTRVAAIDTTDASGQQGDRSIQKALALPENRNIKLVDLEHFGATDMSVTAQAQHVLASGAEAVFVGSAGTPTGTLLRGLADAGLRIPALTSPANMNVDQLTRYQDFIPKEFWFSGAIFFDRARTGPLAEPDNLFYNSLATLGLKPTPPHALAWDAVMIVVSALRKLGTNTTPEALHAYLENLHGYAGVNGIYDFRKNQHGLDDKSIVMTRWDPVTHYWYPISGPGGESLKGAR